MNKPIIIGAGISGLVAAIELEKAGYAPTILEASNTVGGRVKTTDYDGIPLDHGFQVLLTDYPEAQAYLDYKELDLLRFSPGSVIYKQGKAQRIGDPQRDFSFALSTLLADVGTLRDKILILRLSRKLKTKSLEHIFSEAEKSTLQYLKDVGFSSKIIENFFQPFFAGIFLEDRLDTSSRMFEFVYKMFSTGNASIPSNGIETIPKQLASKLLKTTIRLNTPVERIENLNIILKNGEILNADSILIATDPSAVISNYQKPAVEWKSCYNFYFKTETPRLKETIIGLLPGANTLVNNFHFLNDVFGSKPNHNILSVTVVNSQGISQDEMVSNVRKELQELCNIKADELIASFHIKKALPNICDLVYEPTLEEVRLTKGIYTCGDHLANGSLNAAMASGRVAARKIAADLEEA